MELRACKIVGSVLEAGEARQSAYWESIYICSHSAVGVQKAAHMTGVLKTQ